MNENIGQIIEILLVHIYNIIQFLFTNIVYTAIVLISSLLWLIYLGQGGVLSIFMTCALVVYLIFLTWQVIQKFVLETGQKTVDVIKSNTKKTVKAIGNVLKDPRKEVFNISENKYTYDDARLVCKALNADLATYDQVESAYNAGGEWCSYGWSEGQMALFPIQKKTHSKLQTIKGHENDCGRPGINGGYFEDKELQFGVNCYGVKPKMNKISQKIIAATSFFPQSEDDLQMKLRVDELKNNINDIIISPFNQDRWKQI